MHTQETDNMDGSESKLDAFLIQWSSLGFLLPEWVILLGALSWLGIKHILDKKPIHKHNPGSR